MQKPIEDIEAILLAATVFSIGAGATGASDHLYYNSTGRRLWYDPDGGGSQAAVAIASLGPGLHRALSQSALIGG